MRPGGGRCGDQGWFVVRALALVAVTLVASGGLIAVAPSPAIAGLGFEATPTPSAPEYNVPEKRRFQTLLESDGEGRIFMNDGSRPTWEACRPDLTGCSPFATGDFTTAGAPPETVFWAGGSAVTPVWKGTVSPAAPPSVDGALRADEVVAPVAGGWNGGWSDDYDELTLAICRSPQGHECATVDHEGREYGCGAPGATLIDPAFTGWYLRVTDHHWGAGTIFGGVGHDFYFHDVEPVSGPIVSVAVVGRIAAATGPVESRCRQPLLMHASISSTGKAKVECQIVGCRTELIARRSSRRAARRRSRIPMQLGGLPRRPKTLGFRPAAFRKLGNGPLRLTLEINGKRVARRTVAVGSADDGRRGARH
jgi:hypothetical protein